MEIQARNNWWSRLIALIAVINLILVSFNLSYLSLRDIYFRHTPWLVRVYDPVKGIEPHPDTETYLQTSDRLRQRIIREGLTADAENLLASLRQQSIFSIEENPFLASNKPETFAKLKHRMEYRLQTRSAKEAFERFWSWEYLSSNDLAKELAFFKNQIEPLLKVNYYRRIDASGSQVDLFWRIDIWFITFFAIEYLVRTFRIARSRDNLSWGNALWRYWYDALMLIPVWQWLRIIPVTVHLHKSRLFDLSEILAQITHEPAAYISQRATTFAIVRLLNQSQDIISSGAIANVLLSSNEGVTVGDTDKIDKILDRLIGLTIYRVLPQVQPDLEDLLRYSLKDALQESDVYQTIKDIPGFDHLPQEAIAQLSDYLAQATYDVLSNSYSNTEGKIIFNRLSTNFSRTLKQQIQDRATQSEIQVLLSDLLEEWKLNYVKNARQRNPEQTLAEAEQIKAETATLNE